MNLMNIRLGILLFSLTIMSICRGQQTIHDLGFYLISRQNVAYGTIKKIGRFDLKLENVKWYNSSKGHKEKVKIRHVANIENRKNYMEELKKLGLVKERSYLFIFGTPSGKCQRLTCQASLCIPLTEDTLRISNSFLKGVDSEHLLPYRSTNNNESSISVSLREFETAAKYLKNKFNYDSPSRKIYYKTINQESNHLAIGLEEVLLTRYSEFIIYE